MKRIHIICRENYSITQDNDAVSYVQFYNIKPENVEFGDELFLYRNSTHPPFAEGIILGIYQPSQEHLDGHPEREGDIGIVFQVKKEISEVAWPSGRSYGNPVEIVEIE